MIQKIQFFIERELTLDNCVNVAEFIHYEYYNKDEVVFKLGDVGDKFYIIIDGEVSVKGHNKAYDLKLKELRTFNSMLKKIRSAREAYLA